MGHCAVSPRNYDLEEDITNAKNDPRETQANAAALNRLEDVGILDDVGANFYTQGRYKEALEWYERALAGSEKALGKDHPSTLDTVHNIAVVFDHQGRYKEALEWYERALAGKEKALGKDHPSTLDTVDNIAAVFDEQGRDKEALEWYERALASKEKALGK